jgi:hypothetical protein
MDVSQLNELGRFFHVVILPTLVGVSVSGRASGSDLQTLHTGVPVTVVIVMSP